MPTTPAAAASGLGKRHKKLRWKRAKAYQTPDRPAFSAPLELAYQQWLPSVSEGSGVPYDPEDPNYDYRAAYLDVLSGKKEPYPAAFLSPFKGGIHWLSDYKAPWHPTAYMRSPGQIYDTRNSESYTHPMNRGLHTGDFEQWWKHNSRWSPPAHAAPAPSLGEITPLLPDEGVPFKGYYPHDYEVDRNYDRRQRSWKQLQGMVGNQSSRGPF